MPRTCSTTTPISRSAATTPTLINPETGRSAYDGPIARLSETPGELMAAAPLMGEHTFQVATEILGYSADAVGELVASGVLT